MIENEEEGLELLLRERRSVEQFLSMFGHEIKNRLAPIPGFAITCLAELFQLGSNFNQDVYIQFLEQLKKEHNLILPEGFKDAKTGEIILPSKIADLEIKTQSGGDINSIEDFASSWLAMFTEYSLRIYDSSEKSTALLNAVLDLNRVRSGRQKYNMQRLDINRVIKETASELEQRAGSKGLYLNLELDADIPQVRGDLNAMRQILNNLMNNAVKYTLEGGIVVYSREKDGIVEIAVEDTGIGIPESEASKIFEPFGRTSLTGEIEGHGLGMAITYGHVTAHNGKIWFDSEVGKGTIFYLDLPKAIKSKVTLAKHKKTGNYFFLYNKDIQDEIDEIPKDFILGVTDSCLTDFISTLTIPTSTYMQLDDDQKKDSSNIRERLLRPTGKALEKRLDEVRERFIEGNLYFFGTDMDKLRNRIIKMQEGILREELDQALKTEIIPGASREITKGRKGFFHRIGHENQPYSPLYKYELSEEELLNIESSEPRVAMAYILENLARTIKEPKNYLDINSFEKNVSQKMLAFIYANRTSQEDDFAYANEKEKEVAVEQALYDALEKRFEAVEGK